MPEITHLNVQLSGNIFIALFLFVAAVLWTSYVYKNTNPVVSTRLRRFLLQLRLVSVFCILALLFEPVLGISLNWKKKPSVCVLVDRSASMNLHDTLGSRQAHVTDILRNETWNNVAEKSDLHFFTFDRLLHDEFIPTEDSLVFDGSGTNISNAIANAGEQLAEAHCSGMIIITDGVTNEGESLSRIGEQSTLPIYPIAIGSPQQQKDLIIRAVAANEVTYVDTRIPVEVSILNQGYADRNVWVRIEQNGEIVESKTFQLTSDEPEKNMLLHVTPSSHGLLRYDVKIASLENELTYENNRKTIYLRVLEKRLKVILITGTPSLDAKYVKQVLEDDENIEINFLAEKKGGGFYQPPTQDISTLFYDVDCVLLINFPTNETQTNLITSVHNAVANRDIPVIWFWGNQVDFSKVAPLYEFLPAQRTLQVRSSKLIYAHLTEQALTHPLFFSEKPLGEMQHQWQQLPPIYSAFDEIPLWPDAQVLSVGMETNAINSTDNASMPVIVIRELPNHKSGAVFAEGLWRWKMMMWGVGQNDTMYRNFITNFVRWIANRETRKRFRVLTDKEIYRGGDEIRFDAHVYTHDFQPIDNAEVAVTIRNLHDEQLLLFQTLGNGHYRAETNAVNRGKYVFEATAQIDGRIFATDSGDFNVTEWGQEFISTATNVEGLRKLAALSGGELISERDISLLSDKLNLSRISEKEHREWQLWNRPLLLIVIIALFTAEWFVRKKRGMI